MITRQDPSAQRASARRDDARLRIMRRLRLLGVGVVLIGLIGAVPIASAGGPPEDHVTIIGPTVDEIDCDGEPITRTATGWFSGPAGLGDPATYHLTWTYSNVEGQAWTYVDTGVIRLFERDGALYVSVSGRSVNVGPDGTGWVGHWESNTVTNEVRRAGLGVGEIDQLACGLLGSSS